MKTGRNDLCWCGSGLKYKKCHEEMEQRIACYRRQGYDVPDRGLIKTKEQIEGIRRSAAVNMAVLTYVSENIREGISTEEIDRMVADKTAELGGIAAPLNYEGFPKSVCTSINQVVCHGIPGKDRILENGDIINVDVSTLFEGYYSDSSRMFLIGDAPEERRHVMQIAKECMDEGIRAAGPWRFLSDIARAVNSHAKANGCSVVAEIGGHGIGLEFHEEPWVGYTEDQDVDMLLVPGMVITIEPMINAGSQEIIIDEEDGWTVYTADNKPSAQWEVTIVITDDGCEILAC